MEPADEAGQHSPGPEVVPPFTGQYTPEQLDELRKAVRQQLRGAATGVVETLLKDLQDVNSSGVDQALQVLQERGIIEQLAGKIMAPPQAVANAAAATMQATYLASTQPAPPVHHGNPYLHVKIKGGKAFTDYVARAPLPGEQLRLSVELFGQRLEAAPVPSGTEPAFTGEAYIQLPTPPAGLVASVPPAPAGLGTGLRGHSGTAGARGAGHGVKTVTDVLQYLQVRQPMHLVVTSSLPTSAQGRHPAGAGSTHRGATGHSHDPAPDLDSEMAATRTQHTVVALGLGDWRTVLLRRKPVVVSVQLGSGPGTALGLPAGAAPAGVVHLQLSLHPPAPTALDEPLLALQQRSEAARDAEASSAFIQAAKGWWASYLRVNMDFRARPVKVLARGEDGCQLPSCSFVQPLRVGGRLLSNPREAARFVALLRQRDGDDAMAGAVATLGGPGASGGGAAGVAECWCTLHTILTARAASKEELATLLASLLLGFGLDAYVAVGRLKTGPGHMWVVTRGAFTVATHWEPATGVRYTSFDGASCPYATVGSVFNHLGVWANCQADDGALTTTYLLEEPTQWLPLQVPPSDRAGPGWTALPLRPNRADVFVLEEALEAGIKRELAAHRARLLSQQQGAPAPGRAAAAMAAAAAGHMPWDEALSHLLMPALAAYEHEAVTGEVAPGNEEFQAAIKRFTPVGWVFKGVPQHHKHLSASVIAASLAEDPQARDILLDTSPQHAFGLRVKVWPYPEGLFSVWVMLAVKLHGGASGY